MSNVAGVKGNINLFRDTYKKMVSMGEAAIGQDFIMTVEGYPDLQYLVQSVSIPPMKRDPIETYGPHGVKFVQQGKYEGSVEIPITFKETIYGHALDAIKDWIVNKRYLEVTLQLVSESNPTGTESGTFIIEDAWFETDNTDMSVDEAIALKPNGTLHGIYYPQ